MCSTNTASARTDSVNFSALRISMQQLQDALMHLNQQNDDQMNFSRKTQDVVSRAGSVFIEVIGVAKYMQWKNEKPLLAKKNPYYGEKNPNFCEKNIADKICGQIYAIFCG